MIIDVLDNSFFVVRDDLYPFIGGGNKGRKLSKIGDYVKKNNYNAIVTTGGIQSNHCRAAAIFAAQNNMECTLVLHGDEKRFHAENGNAKLMRLSGSRIVFTEAKGISDAMDAAVVDYYAKDLNPYYLRGGGHTLEGAMAYVDAVKDLFEITDTRPDYIFLPTGTGSTQAGIMAGLDLMGSDCKVVGISVGRERNSAETHVTNLYCELRDHLYLTNGKNSALVLDDYLCGGYEKSNEEINDISEKSLSNYGFVLDTTYTAKAFYGMMEYVRKKSLKGHIFFWHTGGILNFLAKSKN